MHYIPIDGLLSGGRAHSLFIFASYRAQHSSKGSGSKDTYLPVFEPQRCMIITVFKPQSFHL